MFDLFKSGNEATKPIVIIIYNFDEFVKNCTKPFVYNFFNITTSKNCPMALIGITRKLVSLRVILLSKKILCLIFF